MRFEFASGSQFKVPALIWPMDCYHSDGTLGVGVRRWVGLWVGGWELLAVHFLFRCLFCEQPLILGEGLGTCLVSFESAKLPPRRILLLWT